MILLSTHEGHGSAEYRSWNACCREEETCILCPQSPIRFEFQCKTNSWGAIWNWFDWKYFLPLRVLQSSPANWFIWPSPSVSFLVLYLYCNCPLVSIVKGSSSGVQLRILYGWVSVRRVMMKHKSSFQSILRGWWNSYGKETCSAILSKTFLESLTYYTSNQCGRGQEASRTSCVSCSWRPILFEGSLCGSPLWAAGEHRHILIEMCWACCWHQSTFANDFLVPVVSKHDPKYLLCIIR